MRDAFRTIGSLPARIVRNTSVATRLSLVVLLVALVSLVITSIVGLQKGSDLADRVLRDQIEALGAARGAEVELYISSLERAAIAQATSPSTADAIAAFSDSYREIDAQGSSDADEAAVDSYYIDEVAPALSEIRNRPVSAASLIPMANAATYLQANYVVRGGDERRLLDDAGDGSGWSELHDSLHQSFSEVVIQTGVDDLYLIEPINQTVVYSTSKNIDFATSLLTGPHSGSALGTLITSFDVPTEPRATVLRDFTSYSAAGGEPSAFIASPVIIEGTLVGFVAFRFSPARINSLATNDGMWTEGGESWQTYVVARDGRMRSDARGFVEDQAAYFEDVTTTGAATADQIRLMQEFATTALFQPVGDVDAAFEEPSSLVGTVDYLGAEVFQARRTLEIDGVEWAMLTEVDRQEFEQPVFDFTRNLLVAIAVFLVVITFLAVRWSDRLLLPVRLISTNLRKVRAGEEHDLALSGGTLSGGSVAEFVSLTNDIDSMVVTLDAHNSEVRERTDERHRLLRRLLPPQVARRAESGERNVIDQVSQATIAVVVIRGLGPLLQSGSSGEARALLDRFVEEADALAKQRGLERIRLTGDAYFAGCGTVRPLIDHAARAVGFVLDVRELLDDLSQDASNAISIGVGVDSGPVTVGLTGGSGLVYDAWGSTVQRAAELARRAAPNTVVVSGSTRSQLPATFEIDDSASIAVPGAAVVAGRLDPEAVR